METSWVFHAPRNWGVPEYRPRATPRTSFILSIKPTKSSSLTALVHLWYIPWFNDCCRFKIWIYFNKCSDLIQRLPKRWFRVPFLNIERFSVCSGLTGGFASFPLQFAHFPPTHRCPKPLAISTLVEETQPYYTERQFVKLFRSPPRRNPQRLHAPQSAKEETKCSRSISKSPNKAD